MMLVVYFFLLQFLFETFACLMYGILKNGFLGCPLFNCNTTFPHTQHIAAILVVKGWILGGDVHGFISYFNSSSDENERMNSGK
jgi:hypothetical protein